QILVLGGGHETRVIGIEATDDDPGADRPVVANRVGLDCRGAFGGPGHGNLRQRSDLCLRDLGAVGAPFDGLGRVDADRIFAHDAAVGAYKAELTGRLAHFAHSLGDTV